MTLSVIIVSWRVSDFLRLCLRSVLAGTHLRPEEWEIIVVDNASDDGSVEMVRHEFPQVRCFENSVNLGFGAANNQALPLAAGRLLLLLNPDTEVEDGAIDRMVGELEARPETGALGCRIVNTDGTFQACSLGDEPNLLNVACHFLFLNRLLPMFRQLRSPYAETESDGVSQVGWLSGACLLLRRSALTSTIFDERYFMYCEDVDLCSRLRSAGWHITYMPSAQVVHHEGRSFSTGSTDVQLHKVRSMKLYLQTRYRGPARLLCDAFMVTGFLLRAGIVSMQCIVQPSERLTVRKALIFRFLREAIGSFGTAVSP